MEINDLISVIVPVYNSEKYLNKCVDSIINQTYKNLEIILVDDGSTDKSGALCDEYAKLDSRIRVIHKENGGQATARNMALDISTGAYIGFVDSDDYIELEMYETMINSIKLTCSDVAMCGRNLVSPDYETKKEMFSFKDQIVFNEREIRNRFLSFDNLDGSPCDKLFSRELFKKESIRFPTEKYVCEDLPFVFKLLFNAKSLVHTGKTFYNYYQRENSTSRSEYSEKTYGLIYYPSQIKEMVIEKYPEYIEIANFYYAINLLNFIIIFKPKYNRKEYKKFKKELLGCEKVIKKYGNAIVKRNFRLIKIGLFHFLLNIKKKISK